jgi:hypothetical protein
MNKKNLYIAAILALSSAVPVACSDDRLSDTSNEQIPIIAYEGTPTKLWTIEGYGLEESYKDMAEAGFTINLPLDIGFHRGNPTPGAHDGNLTPEHYFTTLDVAHANGMKIFVSSESILTFSPEDISRLISHPALAGYRVWDEPWVEKYDTVAQVVKRVQAIDNTHPCYVNSFGMWEPDYPDHLRQFIEKVPVPQLSYDLYAVVLNKDSTRGIKKEFYESLELFSREAKRINKPFWAFALSFNHWDYPVPTLADLRLQVYSDLAYGAQAITYYSYWSLPLEFGWVKEEYEGPISRKGKKTDAYYAVQAMNKEIKALSKVFLNAKMIWTAYTGEVPESCKPLSEVELPKIVKSVEIADNRNALISYMEKGDDHFLIIVNQDLNRAPMQARITSAKKTNLVTKGGTVVANNEKMQAITAGDALIYFWKK